MWNWSWKKRMRSMWPMTRPWCSSTLEFCADPSAGTSDAQRMAVTSAAPPRGPLGLREMPGIENPPRSPQSRPQRARRKSGPRCRRVIDVRRRKGSMRILPNRHGEDLEVSQNDLTQADQGPGDDNPPHRLRDPAARGDCEAHCQCANEPDGRIA